MYKAMMDRDKVSQIKIGKHRDQIAEYNVKGTPALIVNGKEMTVCAGQVVVMPANVPHSVTAVKRFKMLLTVVEIYK